MNLQGSSGRLLVGGREAARLRNWTLEHLEVGSVIRATVEPVNPFWLEHCPRFDLLLRVGSQTWRWRGIKALVDQGLMRVYVEEKPEVRHSA